VVSLKSTDISEEHVAVVFKLVSCLLYSSTLKREAICYSETSVNFNGVHGVISQKTELFIILHNSIDVGVLRYSAFSYVIKI
jgi:hypothetical protein